MDEDYDKDVPSLNEKLGRLLATTMISDVANHDSHGEEDSRNEPDSHVNILVVGRHVHVFSRPGRISDMKLYTPEYKTMQI